MSGHPWDRRLADVLLSSVGMLLLLPVLLAIAITIRFTSSGPVWARVSRWGLWGQPIELFRFRIHEVDSNELTGLGRWLAPLHLEKLPELINVLKGDLSLVGPRALQPIHNVELAYAPTLDGMPGITGRAQLCELRGDRSRRLDDVDMEYLDQRTFLRDMALLARTPFTIVRIALQSPEFDTRITSRT